MCGNEALLYYCNYHHNFFLEVWKNQQQQEHHFTDIGHLEKKQIVSPEVEKDGGCQFQQQQEHHFNCQPYLSTNFYIEFGHLRILRSLFIILYIVVAGHVNLYYSISLPRWEVVDQPSMSSGIYSILFAPIVFIWFTLIGVIGAINIWKYDSTILKAFSLVYRHIGSHVYRHYPSNHPCHKPCPGNHVYRHYILMTAFL